MRKLPRLLLAPLKSRRGVILFLGLLYTLIAGGVGWIMPPYPRATLKPPDSSGIDRCGFMQFSPDSKTLMTAGRGEIGAKAGPICVWDVKQGVERFTLAPDWDKIDPLAFSPDGKYIAAHQVDGHLKLWDASTGKKMVGIKLQTGWSNKGSFVFSPDSRLLAIDDDREGSQQDYIRLWDIQRQREAGSIDCHFSTLTFSHDGRTAATFSQRIDGPKGITNRIMLWRFDEKNAPTLASEHYLSGESIAFSPNLDTVAIVVEAGKSARIELRDMMTAARRCSFSYEPVSDRRPSLRFAPDGKKLFVGVWSKLTLWDVSSAPKEIQMFDDDLAISTDGRWIATPSRTGATVFSVERMEEHGKLINEGDSSPFERRSGLEDWKYSSIVFSPDSRSVAIGKLFHSRKASLLRKWLPGRFDSFGHPVLDNTHVRLWDVASRQELAAFENCQEAVFSSDGTTIATLHFDNTVKLWNLPIRKPLGRILAVAALIWLFPAGILGLGIILIRKWKRV